MTPPQLFVGSFVILVLLGTLGLKTLPGLYTGEPLSWLDALLTATSAVCVTGLVVEDTSTYFTPLGQAYLLLLIQLGGLGMLTFTSLILVMLGRRLSLWQEALAAGSSDESSIDDPRRLVFNVVRFTFGVEAAGALLLYLCWVPRLGWRAAAWPAVFHSVSAFCNAGFSTFSDNLVPVRESPVGLLVLMALIVLGGLGLVPVKESYQFLLTWRRGRASRLSLHTQLTLATTAFLLVAGWFLMGSLEWNGVLAELSFFDRLVNALFLSVTARTAGFNTIDYARASEATCFLTILFMMIGGSPGSTAGGIKTTTFALLGILAWSRLRGQEVASLLNRSLREETTDRATGLAVLAFGAVTAGILVLTLTEESSHRGSFLDWMFEAVSAFGTVGLSRGQTPRLSSAGRCLVVGLMFLGRVGPLTLAAALSQRVVRAERFRYAYEEVMVG